MKKRIRYKQKNKKIGFEMMDSQRKTLRKKWTLRKRKIKRKSLKFGGHPQFLVNSHLGIGTENEKKTISGFWTPSKPNTVAKKRFLEYKIPLKSLHLKYGYDCTLETYTEKKIIVLWVRHCYSCANDAEDICSWLKDPLKEAKQKMFREPLCTLRDKREILQLGKNLLKTGKEIRFFSSFLPRAMETAKVISQGYTQNQEDKDSEIRRLRYVSEETKFYDCVRWDNKTSQSKTTLRKSDIYAKFLNKYLYGLNINDIYMDNQVDEVEGLNGVLGSKMGKYYTGFLEKYILDPESLLLENKINVIVSHGGYIRMNISEPQQILTNPKISKIDHPKNIECFLVKYTVGKDGQITCEKDTLDTLVAARAENLDTLVHALPDPNNLDTLVRTGPVSQPLKDDPCQLSYENIIMPSIKPAEKKT